MNGITPTCVGNTTPKKSTKKTLEDHPHLRGEYTREIGRFLWDGGSPPLAWGIRRPILARKYVYRITPTCVGNTKRAKKGAKKLQDHPHLRGEYISLKPSKISSKGSPPLAWGIRPAFYSLQLPIGITPTCVGNTRRKRALARLFEDHPHLRGEYIYQFII